jgi:hypothetical protein
MSNGINAVILPPFSAGLSFALFLNSSKTLPLAITNNSAQVMSWTAVAASGAANWLSLDRISGSLIAHEVQTIYVTAQSGQAIGDIPGTLTFTPSVGAVEVLSAELHVSQEVYSDNGPKAPTVSQNRIDFVTQRINNIPQGISSPLQFTNPLVNGQVQWTMKSMVNWLSVVPNTGILLGGASLPLPATVAANQNAQASAGTYTTDLILTLTFSDPALAGHEPTSILIPISDVVP